jgi:N6-adenosine-specific RNA methylase IME4
LPGPARGAGRHYDLISETNEIAEVYDLHTFALPDSRLFLWRVASMQQEALDLMRAWGFTLKSEIVWLKETKTGKPWFGMGRQVRNSHETCLIGIRGQPERLSASIRSVFSAPYTRHSGKPEAFYEIVEALSPGPYLELFARKTRPGWVSLGKEVDDE